MSGHASRVQRHSGVSPFRAALIAFFVLVSAVAAQASDVLIDGLGYAVNPPESWEASASQTQQSAAFIHSSGQAIFQILAFSGRAYQDSFSLAEAMETRFQAEGEGTDFLFNGRDAFIADMFFSIGNIPVRAWAVFINTDDLDVVLIAYAVEDSYEEFNDQLLSCIDSYSMEETDMLLPGPVSQFLAPFPPDGTQAQSVAMRFSGSETAAGFRTPAGASLSISVDPLALQTAQDVIEREARIVLTYGEEEFEEGWRRYYRTIFRDTYHRLDALTAQIDRYFRTNSVPREQWPVLLLSWLQTFEYERLEDSVSDFLAPESCVANASGDCDSRAMVYIVLLRHFGFRAILMASMEYSHAMAAVDIAGTGARFTYNGTRWLVAETTDQVAIGLIDQNMSNSAGWVGIDF